MTDLSIQREIMNRAGYYGLKIEDTLYCPFHKEGTEFFRMFRKTAEVPNLGRERLWTIYQMAKQSLHVQGSFFECGVYVGGTSLFLAQILEGSGKTLHLFDTFAGMPETDPMRDWHKAGDFADAPIEQVRRTVGHEHTAVFHQGWMPATFAGMERERIAFAHIDTDIYQSTMDCCEFVFPRMAPGGVIVFDDYGQITCDGARVAIDEYFADKREVPLSLMTKQAVVFKMGET